MYYSCIKKFKWGFSVPFTCRPCLATLGDAPPANTSTARRPYAVSRAGVLSALPQPTYQVAAPPPPVTCVSPSSDMDITLAAARPSSTSVSPSYVITPPPYTTPEPVLTPPPSTPISLDCVPTLALPNSARAEPVITEPRHVPTIPTTHPRLNVVQQCLGLNQPRLSLDLGEIFPKFTFIGGNV